jgi:Lrp/AsnC family leucine-responsive transcriptional regulator
MAGSLENVIHQWTPVYAQARGRRLQNERARSTIEQLFANNHLTRATFRHRMELDRYDRQILAALQADGKLSNQDLADRIGLSPSPCLRRVRALEEAGYLVGYRALVDARKLGLTLLALIHISMDRHTPERFDNFETAIKDIPEVIECLLITGQDADYQLKVIVRDMDAYQELLLNRITRIAGVTGVHSSFVLRRVVERTALPV